MMFYIGNVETNITEFRKWDVVNGWSVSPDGKCLVKIRSGAVIWPGVVIGSYVTIGSHAVIWPYVKIGSGVKIGSHAVIRSYAVIRSGVVIGSGVKIGPGYNLPTQPIHFSSPRYTIGYYSPGMINSGCITKPVEWWLENIERCAEEHDYTPDEIKEYTIRVKLIAEWMKAWGVYDG